MKWTILKSICENHLNKAGIRKGSQSYKLIMIVNRRANTLQNMRSRGVSWSSLKETKAFKELGDALEPLNGNGLYNKEAIYYNEWKKYCDVSGNVYDSSRADFLA